MAGISVFGSEPAGITAFSESGPSGGDDFRLAENIGADLLVSVTGPKEVTTSFGVKTAIQCERIVRLSDSAVFRDVLIFNAAPVDQLRDKAGQMLVVSVSSYETKQGGKAPRFIPPSAEAVAAAEKVGA